jgi:hypothetical protein
LLVSFTVLLFLVAFKMGVKSFELPRYFCFSSPFYLSALHDSLVSTEPFYLSALHDILVSTEPFYLSALHDILVSTEPFYLSALQSGKSGALPPQTPLRTGLDSFPSCGSSTPKAYPV